MATTIQGKRRLLLLLSDCVEAWSMETRATAVPSGVGANSMTAAPGTRHAVDVDNFSDFNNMRKKEKKIDFYDLEERR